MKNSEELISIIIPCYNCERWLPRTVDCLINQTINNFEVIFVNDGSTDNSLNIVKKILSKSSLNYKIIDQVNSGVSIARNNGIKAAKGKYIYFLDADDKLDYEFCEHIEKLSRKEDFEICFFNYIKEYKDIGKKPKYSIYKSESYDSRELLNKILDDKFSYHMCSFIIKRQIIESNSIKFMENCRYGEDHEFIIKSLINCKKVYISEKVFFYYVMREDSAVHKFNIDRIDSIKSALRVEEYIKNRIEDQEAQMLAKKYIANKVLYNLKEFVKIDNQNEIDKDTKKIFLQNINDVKHYFKYLDYNEKKYKKRIIKSIICLNIKLYLYLLNILKNN